MILGEVTAVSSTFTWLDHSESDRRKMQRVIDLFREVDTRDELGIGQVRDAFSDLLFPGTSTIQTRARYLLFLPWIFTEMEAKKIPSRRARVRGRDFEVSLIDALVHGDVSTGVIGIVARATVKRLASSVYWHGLGVLGIRQFNGSIEDYYRSLDSFYRAEKTALTSESGELVQRVQRNWHAGVPEAPPDFLTTATMDLTHDEADYLRDRMRINISGSMLAAIVDIGEHTAVETPWTYPYLELLSDQIREQLLHAQNFAEAMHGSALVYNLMLAELAEREDLIERYHADLDEWSRAMEASARRFSDWDQTRFWEIVQSRNSRVARTTRRFTDQWLRVALAEPRAIADSNPARDLIEDRERSLKRSQARLSNRRALEKWNEASGTAILNYRWPVSQTIANDIVDGLQESANA